MGAPTIVEHQSHLCGSQVPECGAQRRQDSTDDKSVRGGVWILSSAKGSRVTDVTAVTTASVFLHFVKARMILLGKLKAPLKASGCGRQSHNVRLSHPIGITGQVVFNDFLHPALSTCTQLSIFQREKRPLEPWPHRGGCSCHSKPDEEGYAVYRVRILSSLVAYQDPRAQILLSTCKVYEELEDNLSI
ncbi:hypothetical protein STEG23_009233 [Scotinomys teguina]